MSVITLKRAFGCIFVQTFGLKYEADFFERGSRGKVINFPQIKFWFMLFFFRGACSLFVQYNIIVMRYIYKISMPS